MIRLLGTGFAALLGLAFGSFLNVCLSRWPEGESVVKPRSHCRSCGHQLAWWENVPVVSWIALGGRCRECRAWIGFRYVAVEATIAVLWGLVAWQDIPRFETPLPLPILAAQVIGAFGQLVFLWIAVALAVLDFEHLWLPNWLTLGGAALGLATAIATTLCLVLTRNPDFVNSVWVIPIYNLACAVAGALLIIVIRWLYWLIRKQEGIGLGDAKLMAMLGAWLGLNGAVLAFAFGVILGAVSALITLALPRLRRGEETWAVSRLPLGTFLSVGGIVSALWGTQIVDAYMHWAGF